MNAVWLQAVLSIDKKFLTIPTTVSDYPKIILGIFITETVSKP